MSVQVDAVIVVELLVQFVRDPEANTGLRVEVDRLYRVELTVTVGLLVVLDVVPHGGSGDDHHLEVTQITVQRHLLKGNHVFTATDNQELTALELERLFKVVLPP
ncbi:hypothetical protein D3C75_1020770 [compost metagenome]